jgi:hypothetical protein
MAKTTGMSKTRKRKARVSKKPPTARMPAASKPRAISEYHAHVYYDPQTTRDRAARLRDRVACWRRFCRG